MNRPDWKPTNEDARRAFTQWIHDELDRQDEAELAKGDNPFAFRFVERQLALVQLAKEVGQPLAKPKRPVGAPKKVAKDRTDYDWAALDVPRIRAIFTKHWGQRNRTVPPMAEQIAAERWELSREDTNRLIDRFQRKS